MLSHLPPSAALTVGLSSYQTGHTTETAISKLWLIKTATALDRGDLTTLTLLDLSTAFDTVDHVILS